MLILEDDKILLYAGNTIVLVEDPNDLLRMLHICLIFRTVALKFNVSKIKELHLTEKIGLNNCRLYIKCQRLRTGF